MMVDTQLQIRYYLFIFKNIYSYRLVMLRISEADFYCSMFSTGKALARVPNRKKMFPVSSYQAKNKVRVCFKTLNIWASSVKTSSTTYSLHTW
jgi:hypothetical protein